MPPDKVVVDYELLSQAAERFRREAERQQRLLDRLRAHVDRVAGVTWVGLGAGAFRREVYAVVLPALGRLVSALFEAQRAAQRSAEVMRAAELEAAALFRGTVVEAPPPGGAFRGAGAALSGGVAAFPAFGFDVPLPEEIENLILAGKMAAGAVRDVMIGLNVTLGNVSRADAPREIRFPPTLVREMEQAWADTAASGNEQGGLVVVTPGQQLDFIRGPEGHGTAITPDYNAVRPNRWVGFIHTHPNADGNTSFSDNDIALLFQSHGAGRFPPLKMIAVQAGDEQHVLVVTPEFASNVSDPGTALSMMARMARSYRATLEHEKQRGTPFNERINKAVKNVASTFDLLYYRGKDGVLVRQ